MVRVLKMRGTHGALSVLDSQLVFNGTDAQVVILTDNTRKSIVSRLNTLLTEGPGSRKAQLVPNLRALLHSAVDEEATLVDLALAAVSRGLSSRLTFLGLSKRDIIEYLPADSFVPGSTWPLLTAE